MNNLQWNLYVCPYSSRYLITCHSSLTSKFVDKILWFYPSNETSWAVPLQSTRGGTWLAPPPPPPASYFWTKLRSKRPKKKFFYTEPPLSQGLDDCSPPPILSQWLDLPLSTICTWIIMFIRILQNKFALLFWWIFFSLAIIKSGSINIDHMTFATFILYSVTQKLHIINSLERWD